VDELEVFWGGGVGGDGPGGVCAGRHGGLVGGFDCWRLGEELVGLSKGMGSLGTSIALICCLF
jgi:hypothetical protein